MLAFLGAIVCIIASVHPAASPARAPSGAAADNDSSAGTAALLPPGPEQSLSALHGPGGSAGPHELPLPGGGELLASARPLQHPMLFSRFLCTPLATECPTAADGAAVQGDGPGSGQQQQQQQQQRQREEELLALQSTAEQLRQTALQQKARIRADQEAIRELTGKLGRCESGLQLPFQDPGPSGRQDTMSDGPAWDSPAVVRELEEAVRALKERIEKIEQELPVHGNVSATTTRPLPSQDPLHTQMETLEAQLLSKVMALEKERSSLSSSNHKQQQAVEKELNALQDRVAELEHGASAYSPPDAFKINIPVKNNYMYARVRRTLPELYAFTICMWLKSKSGGMGIGTPFSYSVPGQSNEMVLLEAGHDPMELLINDKVAQLPLNLKDGRWHHICIVWTTRDGLWSAYQDGQLRGSSDNLAAWHPIKPHGIIILGQEQVKRAQVLGNSEKEGRKEERKEGREGRREKEGRKEWSEGKNGGREGRKEWREGGREREREGGREEGKKEGRNGRMQGRKRKEGRENKRREGKRKGRRREGRKKKWRKGGKEERKEREKGRNKRRKKKRRRREREGGKKEEETRERRKEEKKRRKKGEKEER
uniref:Neuronal pentraxin receptor n=1 Tax=Sarcophilus harrisii TaxID=9305 RepID=A0A7N4PAA3_SARHA